MKHVELSNDILDSKTWVKIPGKIVPALDYFDLFDDVKKFPGNGKFAISFVWDAFFFEKEEDAILFVLKHGSRL